MTALRLRSGQVGWGNFRSKEGAGIILIFLRICGKVSGGKEAQS